MIMIKDKGKEWEIEIQNEVWEFDTLVGMANVLNDLKEYTSIMRFEGYTQRGWTEVDNNVQGFFLKMNQMFEVKDQKELKQFLDYLIKTKITHGRWKK